MVKEEIALLVVMLAGYFALRDWKIDIRHWKTLPARFLDYLRHAPRISPCSLPL